jgi:saccharopine dehydrogenase-like NADP-dependent oxidoreductase
MGRGRILAGSVGQTTQCHYKTAGTLGPREGASPPLTPNSGSRTVSITASGGARGSDCSQWIIGRVARQPASGILVVGAGGYFGSLLVEDLLRHTDANVWVAGRGRRGLERLLHRVGPVLSRRLTLHVCDLADPASVDLLVPGVRAAVCAAGPYQGLPLTLLESCVKHGVPYLDLADDRRFYLRARDWVARQDKGRVPAVCVGWSAVPALSGLLARMAAEGMDRVDDLFVQIAPGNRFPRNQATVASLLASLGKPCRLWREGEWREVLGWSEPRAFEFPPPIGRQRGYIVDVPDHEIFPTLFHARRVEFRVGSELAVFNYGASVLAWLSRRFAIQWDPWAGWLRRAKNSNS